MSYITIVTDNGDGQAIYVHGSYMGTADQVDPWQLLVDSGEAELLVVAPDYFEQHGAPPDVADVQGELARPAS